ncbi:hypothetical protein [Flavobacterium microcysteis]
MKNNFDEYKKAIITRYEEEKMGKFSDLLLDPTPANLKRLCLLISEDEMKFSDLAIFRHFFSFKSEEDIARWIKNFDTEKFKPLSTFLKLGTNLKDYRSANLIAVLVDFNQRPYTKFLDTHCSLDLVNPKIKDTNKELPKREHFAERMAISKPVENDYQLTVKSPLSKRLVLTLLFFASVFFLAFVMKDVFDDKCMIWKGDHYEKIDCEDSRAYGEKSFDNVIAYNKDVLENFRKIEVCDTTTFFINDRPMVWYIKQNGKCEFFSYNGAHPITRKPLKPITKHMVEKHIMKVHNKKK